MGGKIIDEIGLWGSYVCRYWAEAEAEHRLLSDGTIISYPEMHSGTSH